MGYKCRICGANDVEHSGDVCELCAIGQDPYVAAMQGIVGNGGGSVYGEREAFPPYNREKSSVGFSDSEGIGLSSEKESPYRPRRGHKRKILLEGGADVMDMGFDGKSAGMEEKEDEPVQIYQAGQAPLASIQQPKVVPKSASSSVSRSAAVSKEPEAVGIAKNISVDRPRKAFIQKWLKTLFSGIPFMLENEITMFQVFPDYSGTSLNSMGNVCDQVIVYGRLNPGAVAENNDIEVYGYRDARNNVVAKTMINKASGTTIRPEGAIPAWIAWAITLIIFTLLAVVLFVLGARGVIRVVIIIFCITHLPWVLQVFAMMLGMVLSLFRRKD